MTQWSRTLLNSTLVTARVHTHDDTFLTVTKILICELLLFLLPLCLLAGSQAQKGDLQEVLAVRENRARHLSDGGEVRHFGGTRSRCAIHFSSSILIALELCSARGLPWKHSTKGVTNRYLSPTMFSRYAETPTKCSLYLLPYAFYACSYSALALFERLKICQLCLDFCMNKQYANGFYNVLLWLRSCKPAPFSLPMQDKAC